VIAILTDSTNPRVYWSKLKERATSEGFEETLSQVEPLKLKSPNGRFRQTDTANRQTLLRLIQSIPSPRAEPFRLWLAQVGEERLEEIEHPEAALERVRAMYKALETRERSPNRIAPTLETKGRHLENPDTDYKRSVFKLCNDLVKD
jgi:DNA-damage-inducible protein D